MVIYYDSIKLILCSVGRFSNETFSCVAKIKNKNDVLRIIFTHSEKYVSIINNNKKDLSSMNTICLFIHACTLNAVNDVLLSILYFYPAS